MSSLTVLIPTLPERYHLLKRLQNRLLPQVEQFKDRVQIIYNDQGRTLCIGDKRNHLVLQVNTEFMVFIDDDDMVSNNYLSEILKAVDTNPEVVTFNGWMTTNGSNRENFVIKLGAPYEKRGGVYYRYPNHLCPIRTEIARKVPFRSLTSREDFEYATEIRNRGLLKSEVHIDQDLYHYDFVTNKPPYGFQERKIHPIR